MQQRSSQADTTARLHDLARQRAEELREQAMSDLLRDLHVALADAADHSARAARRLTHRLHQHWRHRHAAPVSSSHS